MKWMYGVIAVGALATGATLVNAANVTTTAAYSTVINNQGDVIGKATYRQLEDGVEVSLVVHSLAPGKHGIHLHEHGTCEDTDTFKLSGGHILHETHQHGLENEHGPDGGDLPNLEVAADSTAYYRYVTPRVSLHEGADLPALLDSDGSALIIHESEDDQKTQPIGGAGARVACGKLSIVE